MKPRKQESDRYSGREDDPLVPRQLRQSRHRRPLQEHLPREIKRLEPTGIYYPECDGEPDYPGKVSAAPSRPTERGIAGPGLLARVLTGKYCEHLPLYRQSEIFARQGVELSRALLSNWVARAAKWLH